MYLGGSLTEKGWMVEMDAVSAYPEPFMPYPIGQQQESLGGDFDPDDFEDEEDYDDYEEDEADLDELEDND